MKATPEVSPPIEEQCSNPLAQSSPPTDLLDPSVVTYSEVGGPGSITYVNAEGRLVSWLRAAAQLKDPLELLKQSAVSFYLVGIATRTPPDTVEGATALADLAVTGRGAYSQFRSHPPQESDLIDDVRSRLTGWLNGAPDENRLLTSMRSALDRAYLVTWALRDPNPATRAQTRASLGWIAVSGEDDSPDRPVNMASAAYPQFDTPVICQGISIETRYMIALPEPGAWPAPPPQPIRQVPSSPAPAIPADHDVILFIHGHSSRAEESADLVSPLHQTGLKYGKKYAIIAFDLPSNGYSQMIEHTVVAPSSATQFDTNPLSSSPATYPLLDFLVEFVISFVNTLDAQVQIKNRVAAVIGGSLGGNLCLRLGERNDQPWIKNIVAWSPASVWSTFNHDLVKGVALQALQGRMNEDESGSPPRRIRFFYESFDSAPGPGTPPQPQLWYRDGWACKASYISDDRMERREIYHPLFRRWHWRVALEQLLFSHLNTDTPGGKPRYASNLTHTLLASGQADNYNWSNIYTATKNLANLMVNTPGTSLFLLNTGHSIHNERPLLLAQQIVEFLPGIGHLWHTERRPDGTWSGLGDVNGQFAIPGAVHAVSAASSQPGETQFMFATEDGHLWHTQRRPDGSWSGLGDVNGQFAIPGPVSAVSAASSQPGETQFMFATQDGHLWHTQRRPDGTWSGLGDINGQFAIPGAVHAVSAASSQPGETQFMFATEDGHLWHTQRRPDGSWSGLGDVNGQFAIPGPVQAVSAASSQTGETQFMFATQDGHLWHTQRRPDGTWSGLGDVNGQFAIPGAVHAVSAASSQPGETQFMFATQDGHLWHTQRRPDGSWSGLGDVNGQFAIPGLVSAVSATSSQPGETQFMFTT